MESRYVIKHQNVTGLLSYQLRDYIKELNDKNRLEGLNADEMEWLDEAVNEREMRKSCKSYHPKRDEEIMMNLEFGKEKEMKNMVNRITEDTWVSWRDEIEYLLDRNDMQDNRIAAEVILEYLEGQGAFEIIED